MGGGGVIIILKKNLQTALGLGLTPSGKFKLWHALVATHLLAFLAGLIL